ncbi:MAG: AMP-binding protein [Pseudomonadota bacterium]
MAHAEDGNPSADAQTARLTANAGRLLAAKPLDQTLFEAITATAKRLGTSKTAVQDSEGNTLSYKRLLLGSLILGAKLAKETKPGDAVGVLLPNVAGLVVTLVGLNATGRVPALLNFTAGTRNILSAIDTAPTNVVVTSRRFIEKAGLESLITALTDPDGPSKRKIKIIYLEDVRADIGAGAKAVGALRALQPLRFHRKFARKPDSPAIILFTSGTEGTPKGVVLSNRNIVANAQQIMAHADGFLTQDDVIMNPLPMFHSFGLTAGTFMPLIVGMGIVLHPSPLHYRQIPGIIRKTKASVLFSTDTFLQGYARAAEPGDLASIRFIVAGAEKVKHQTREMWNRLGADIQEGYGVTECAPVLACNLPPINHPGSVGPMLPGVETRITAVDGITEGGRLEVRGPNVMLGYLRAKAPGVIDPPADGWHDTGDIVTLKDGKLAIVGRAKRFAKIAGEMVSLAAVEDMACAIWPDAQHVAVNLPDPKKGEHIVLVTEAHSASVQQLHDYARNNGMSELWVPRSVCVVPEIPLLGSGKIDFGATRRLLDTKRAA